MVDVKPWSRNKRYLVFSDGRIFTTYVNHFLQPYENEGYLSVGLVDKNGKYKTYSVHRVVAETFIDNPLSYPQVNHKDENKQNNCVENLEWCTAKYNNNYGTKNQRAAEAQAIKIVMCDIDTHEPQAIFTSVSNAFRYFDKPVNGHITAVIKGKRKYAYGHWWKQYEGEENLPILL